MTVFVCKNPVTVSTFNKENKLNKSKLKDRILDAGLVFIAISVMLLGLSSLFSHLNRLQQYQQFQNAGIAAKAKVVDVYDFESDSYIYFLEYDYANRFYRVSYPVPNARPGDSIDIYINPANPHQALSNPRITMLDWFTAGIVTAIGATMILNLVIISSHNRRNKST